MLCTTRHPFIYAGLKSKLLNANLKFRAHWRCSRAGMEEVCPIQKQPQLLTHMRLLKMPAKFMHTVVEVSKGKIKLDMHAGHQLKLYFLSPLSVCLLACVEFQMKAVTCLEFASVGFASPAWQFIETKLNAGLLFGHQLKVKAASHLCKENPQDCVYLL